jgi:hypothetical protein
MVQIPSVGAFFASSGLAGGRSILLFCIVLRDGARWAVEAEWPDGSIELVETFGDYFDALNWVTNKAAAWTKQRIPEITKAAGN